MVGYIGLDYIGLFGSRGGGAGYNIGPFDLSRDLIADGARFAPGDEVGIEKRQDYATTAGGTDLAKIYIWQHLGGHVYAQHKMTDASGANRINWYQTWICELFAYYLADEFTLAGAPSIVNTYYYESLGHIGCKAVSLASAGQSASIELTGHSGDIWLAVEDGPDRGGLWVEINGEQDLVTLPEIAAGVKGIDCYAPSTARAQLVRVASNLPTGDYTVSAGFADVKHPLSTDETVLLEAVATPGRLTNSRIRPPFYESETAYVQGDEVVGPDGWSWHCAAAGTTGETPPTPSTVGEDFADGTATWRRYFNYTYNYRTFQIGESTEREYALVAEVNEVENDVGGATHDNENATIETIVVDGDPWVYASAQMAAILPADSIQISEAIEWSHDEAALLATVNFSRVYDRKGLLHTLSITWEVGADIGWVYPVMFGAMVYNGDIAGTFLDTMKYETGESWTFSAYASNDATVGYTSPQDPVVESFQVGAQGALPIDGRDHPYSWLAGVTPETVLSGGRDNFHTYTLMNREGHSGVGANQWNSKTYFTTTANDDKYSVAEDATEEWVSFQSIQFGFQPSDGSFDIRQPTILDDDYDYANSSELFAVWTDNSSGTSSCDVDAGRLALTRVSGSGYPEVMQTISGLVVGATYQIEMVDPDNGPQTAVSGGPSAPLGYGTDAVRSFAATATSHIVTVGGKSTASTETSYVGRLIITRLT